MSKLTNCGKTTLVMKLPDNKINIAKLMGIFQYIYTILEKSSEYKIFDFPKHRHKIILCRYFRHFS